MDKIEMKAPYSRKDIEDWIMKTSDGYLPQTYNLKALTNLIRKYNSDFVVPLQSFNCYTNLPVLKIKDGVSGSAEQEEFNQYFVDILKQDKLISELQERAEIAEDELDKLKQSDMITDEEIEAMAEKEYPANYHNAPNEYYRNLIRTGFIKGAKAIRDKLNN